VTGTGSTDGGCIFCDAHAQAGRPGSHDLVLIRGRATFVILNLYPYNSGHLMVVPARHVATLAQTTAEEQAELMRFTRHAEIALTEVYKPQGLNIGVNLGRPAGAGVLDHLHVHVVPRWNGDTNFMSVIGETRVLPEDLSETAKRLRPVFERLSHEDV
jgi:ATP adenylyltransferase